MLGFCLMAVKMRVARLRRARGRPIAALRFVCKWGSPCLLRAGGAWNFDRLQHPCVLLVGPAGWMAPPSLARPFSLPCWLLCISSRMELHADASRSKRDTVIGEPHRVPRPNRPADGATGSQVVWPRCW